MKRVRDWTHLSLSPKNLRRAGPSSDTGDSQRVHPPQIGAVGSRHSSTTTIVYLLPLRLGIIMSLTKLSLLLVEAYCTHISVKSPTPRSPDHETAQYYKNNKTRDIVQWPNIKGPFLYRVRCLRIIVCASILTLSQYNFYSIAFIEALFILVSILSPSTDLPRIFTQQGRIKFPRQYASSRRRRRVLVSSLPQPSKTRPNSAAANG